MDTTKLKLKLGNHEFEAEGPTEVVQAQFQAFKELIASLPTIAPEIVHSRPQDTQNPQVIPAIEGHVPLEKIMHVSGRIVSLTALPSSPEEAALRILLGHKDLRNSHSVTGQEVGDGLAQSGRPVPRVDRVMEKAIAEASVLKIGMNRSTRYRLTNQGMFKALNIARGLVESLP